jgi:hypothetical protein
MEDYLELSGATQGEGPGLENLSKCHINTAQSQTQGHGNIWVVPDL